MEALYTLNIIVRECDVNMRIINITSSVPFSSRGRVKERGKKKQEGLCPSLHPVVS
jgi:hypothetical protein